ncbi:MAG: SDR family NAD(P)-dependent oxidoreductase [Clostridiales bacterium]|nr:SDR family NAD(P)-dependent oxidoreductase [Clostridiales bacterium]
MKTIVITGATSGIGYAVCRAFAQMRWAVLGVGRSEATCGAAERKLREEFPGADIRFFPCELSKQTEIIRLGETLTKTLRDDFGGRLDALVNNAGCVRNYYTTTEDGYETVFAVNHLAAFLLTEQLLPALVEAGGRVLVTSSQSHLGTKVRWGDVMLTRRYRPLFAYKQSKLCNLLFAQEFNRRFAQSGVRCYGIDPGLVNTGIGEKNTSGVVKLFWRFHKRRGVSADTSAKTYAHVITSDDADSLYYGQRGPQRFSRQVNGENAKRLWALSDRLCGTSF